MKGQKTVQANYTSELVSVIVAEYGDLMAKNGNDNKVVLPLLSAKHGKSIPSLRAKLASVKAYISPDKADNNAPVSADKAAKKEDIAQAISNIVGVELNGLEAATKAALQSILTFLLKVNKLLEQKEAKINELIADLTEEGLYGISDDINDND